MHAITIDWNAFTPWTALAGGALIAAASILLMAFNGRIAGISGIIANILPWRTAESGWRLAFVAGLLLAPIIWQTIATLPEMAITSSTTELIIAGLLVGFGTRLGSGCTSGHGICGLSRLSLRSLVATLAFMSTAIITVYIQRHILGG